MGTKVNKKKMKRLRKGKNWQQSEMKLITVFKRVQNIELYKCLSVMYEVKIKMKAKENEK